MLVFPYVGIRITRLCEDEIDGVPLNHFQLGIVYRVDATVGSYLLATGCAEAVVEDELDTRHEDEVQFQFNMQRWQEVAADLSRRGAPKHRK